MSGIDLFVTGKNISNRAINGHGTLMAIIKLTTDHAQECTVFGGWNRDPRRVVSTYVYSNNHSRRLTTI